MIKRLAKSSGVAAFVAAGLLLVVFGLLEMSRGFALGFSVPGAFQDKNLTRGAGSLLVGAGIGALGATLLYNVLSG